MEDGRPDFFHYEFVEPEDSSDSGVGDGLGYENLGIFTDPESQSLSDMEIEDELHRYKYDENRDWVKVWHYNGLVLHYVGRQWIVADDVANYDYLYGVDDDNVKTEEEEEVEWTETEEELESYEEEEESCECRGACNCRK